MVTERDLKKDYEEVLKSGELDRPYELRVFSVIEIVILVVVIFALTFWTVAWLY